jgi:hypothetical protein
MDKIGIAEAITALRQELADAIVASIDESIHFQVGEVTVELEIAVERLVGGKGGLKFWVVELGGELSSTTSRTHKISLPLTPIMNDGSLVLTGETSLPD